MSSPSRAVDVTPEPSPLTGAEGERLVAAAARAREADRELGAALERPEPAAEAATVGYLDELERRGALPDALERELVAAAQAGDTAARARLVEAFLPLIAWTARVYRDSPQVDRVELIQEGVVGLLRALERYDGGRGVPFWGYAVFWVRQAMQQLVAELTRPLVLSDRALRQLSRIKDVHRDAIEETGREPGREREIVRGRYGLDGEEQSLRDLGGRLGLSAERVRQLEERALRKLAAAAGAG